MAWSFNGLSVKEMTDPMIRGAMDELRAELGCRGQQVMWREDHSVTPVERIAVHCESIFTQRNDGACTSFYSCRICGASVQPMDRETHIEWHGRVR